MLITPPDLAWGCSYWRVVGLLFLGCLAASSLMLPSHVRLTVVGLLHCFVVVRTGLLVPLCGRSWPPAGLLACRSTGPTLQFLYSGQARSRTFQSRRGSGAVRVLPAPGRARLAAYSGADVSSLAAAAAGELVLAAGARSMAR